MSKSPLQLWVSAYEPAQFPEAVLPEIVLVGRSNVGKSLLLNRLTGSSWRLSTPGGARVSSRPGCTRAVHFYHWDDRAVLVDLPGFGYAALSKTARRDLGKLVEAYFSQKRPRLILHLIDARLPLQPLDAEMLAWGRPYSDFYLLLMNKCDKLSRFAMEKKRCQMGKSLSLVTPGQQEVLAISALTGDGVVAVNAWIRAALKRLAEFPGRSLEHHE